MKDDRRNQLLGFVEREFIGPDPIDCEGMLQKNGEEILTTDAPRTRYIAGILFPKETSDTDAETRDGETGDDVFEEEREDTGETPTPQGPGDPAEYLENAEELINRSNAYRQSAISLTAAVSDGDSVSVQVSAGTYITLKTTDPVTEKETVRYPRTALSWDNDSQPVPLPSVHEGIRKVRVGETGLQFDITYRYRKGSYSIFTFTLENTKVNSGAVHDEVCFFQVRFTISSKLGFQPLPDSERINTDDEDYWSNQLLYRDVHNYAIGHGCAAEWDDTSDQVFWISSAVFPSYEIKPIVPSRIPGVSLEMFKMSPYGNFPETIRELRLMGERYQAWIGELKTKKRNLPDRFTATADRHIRNCEECLLRISSGIDLLEQDEKVRTAFQYMNLAMLMQQLHYNLPLQKWEDDGTNNLKLKNPVPLPDVRDKRTWYDMEHRVYGKDWGTGRL